MIHRDPRSILRSCRYWQKRIAAAKDAMAAPVSTAPVSESTHASSVPSFDLPQAESANASSVNIFDLPREIRDMIYAYLPRLAWIDIIHAHPRTSSLIPLHDRSVNQPASSKANRRLREESLDRFYGQNRADIYEHWISAIGDANAGRLRRISFVSGKFTADITICEEAPKVSLKLRSGVSATEAVKGVPQGYTFGVAARRAGEGLRSFLDEIAMLRRGRPLRCRDHILICRFVDDLEPFFCKGGAPGYRPAVLPSGDFYEWPCTARHCDHCSDCGSRQATRSGRLYP
ncbi:hypothetical protein LTR53_008878 [Teratosphaeriaceae sp. CCFEE 6253]|nr:hypothetical protein LTR53_008878 [Teratosphaeriaceae sp. CCFEE 6253]